jgi:hypothetical protein
MRFGLHHIESASFIKGREFHNSWAQLFLWVWNMSCVTTLQLHLIIQKWRELVVTLYFGSVCRQSTESNGVYFQIKLYRCKNSLWGQKLSVNMHSQIYYWYILRHMFEYVRLERFNVMLAFTIEYVYIYIYIYIYIYMLHTNVKFKFSSLSIPCKDSYLY